MESLKELNAICQKKDYKTVGNWMARNIVRDAALPLTWVFLHTPVTANQITAFSLVIGLAACAFLIAASAGAFLAGALLLQLWYLLDHVDGQIARYRKLSSMSGVFFDYITHHIIHMAVFIALGLRAYGIFGMVTYVYAGIAAAFSILAFNLITDCKYKTFMWAVRWKGAVLEYSPKKDASFPREERKASPVRKLFSVLHKACEVHVVMNTLTFAALAQLLWTGLDLSRELTVLYAVSAFLIAVFKIGYIVMTNGIDAEYYDVYGGRPDIW